MLDPDPNPDPEPEPECITDYGSALFLHLNMLSCAIFSELEGEDYVDYVPITNTEPSRHITVKFILKTLWYLCVFCFFLF
jgi:hypothetical protein